MPKVAGKPSKAAKPIIDKTNRTRATGGRKTSTASAWLSPGRGEMVVNDKPYNKFFPLKRLHSELFRPFQVTNTVGQFNVMCKVKGGGFTGQTGATRLAIARALIEINPEYRPLLRKAGLLTRDKRVVERKKFGLKKARKAFQFCKR